MTCQKHLAILAVLIYAAIPLAFTQGLPAREESNLNEVYSEYGLSGEGVVVAIIDRGIDYFHPDFIDEEGNTRLLWLYDMINPDGASNPNNPYGIGTIFSQEEINASLLSEDTLSTDRGGHGTATTGIAAGNGSAVSGNDFQGVAWNAKIIAVKAIQDYFPPFNNQPGQNGFYNPTYIPIALQFVSDKLAEAGMPGVALINLGSIGGSTDGTSTICQAMDNFVAQGHTLVCGVGDDGGQDNHAATTVGLNETITLEIQKSEAGNLRFDLWYSEDDRLEVSIVRPDNTVLGPFSAPLTANSADNQILGDIYYYHRGANVEFSGATSWRREIMIDFTGNSGIYKVQLKGTTIDNTGEFHAVLNPSRYYNNNKFLTHVVEGYSLNDFTSAAGVISPSDYVVKNDWIDMGGNVQQMTGQGDPGELWIGSSWGPAQNEELCIDFAACGEVLHTAYSPNTWYGNFSHLLLQGGNNRYGIQNAVSAAAPLSTGVMALMLELNPSLSPTEIKDILQNTARSDSYTGTVPNIQWGYGKLDAYEAVNSVVNTLGTNLIRDRNNSLLIYPNPVNETLSLDLNGLPGDVRIFNAMGILIYQETSNLERLNIPVSELSSGLYHIIVRQKNEVLSGTFIKN